MNISNMSHHNVVNAADSSSSAGGATDSGRCKAPKVVIQRKPYPRTRKYLVLFRKWILTSKTSDQTISHWMRR